MPKTRLALGYAPCRWMRGRIGWICAIAPISPMERTAFRMAHSGRRSQSLARICAAGTDPGPGQRRRVHRASASRPSSTASSSFAASRKAVRLSAQ